MVVVVVVVVVIVIVVVVVILVACVGAFVCALRVLDVPRQRGLDARAVLLQPKVGELAREEAAHRIVVALDHEAAEIPGCACTQHARRQGKWQPTPPPS